MRVCREYEVLGRSDGATASLCHYRSVFIHHGAFVHVSVFCSLWCNFICLADLPQTNVNLELCCPQYYQLYVYCLN